MYMNLYIYSSHFGPNYTLQRSHVEKYQKFHDTSHCDTVNCIIYIYSMMYYYISFCRIIPLLSANINYIIIVKQ